jgi:hypothetical protein
MPKILISWEVPEFEKHKKSLGWYVTGGIVLLILLIYCIKTANFLFAVILLMAAIIIILYDFRESREVEFALTSSGVKFGEKEYPYENFKRFWIVYEPPEVKKLYLEFQSVAMPRLVVSFNDINPNEIRKFLLEYVAEDLEEKDEPFTDYLGRVLKL